MSAKGEDCDAVVPSLVAVLRAAVGAAAVAGGIAVVSYDVFVSVLCRRRRDCLAAGIVHAVTVIPGRWVTW